MDGDVRISSERGGRGRKKATEKYRVLLQKLHADHPRRVWHNLVDPLAVAQGLGALGVRHHRLALFGLSELVVAHPNQQIDIWEGLFGLLDGPRVAKVEQVVDLFWRKDVSALSR